MIVGEHKFSSHLIELVALAGPVSVLSQMKNNDESSGQVLTVQTVRVSPTIRRHKT